jgi:hypothetical protein
MRRLHPDQTHMSDGQAASAVSFAKLHNQSASNQTAFPGGMLPPRQ